MELFPWYGLLSPKSYRSRAHVQQSIDRIEGYIVRDMTARLTRDLTTPVNAAQAAKRHHDVAMLKQIRDQHFPEQPQ